MTTHKTAKIYKIVNTMDDLIYIGSTTQTLAHRMGQHRGRARKVEQYNCKFHIHMNTVGIEHFKILLIKTLPFTTKDEIELEEFNEISKVEREKLLNENVVYKKRSPDHIKKVSDSQTGSKSVNWKYGSVFKRTGKTSDGYSLDSYCFAYRPEGEKLKRIQFSIKKYGEDVARQMAMDKRKEIYPDATDINF
jgi:hypothetical protein